MISFLITFLFEFKVLCLIIIITLLYYYFTFTYDTFLKLNVPYIQPVPLFGNAFKLTTGLENKSELMNRIYRKFPDAKICGCYLMRTPCLLIRDPELINTILIKDFSYFTDRGLDFDTSVNMIARSLFFMNGQKWKTMRQKLSPGFTTGIKDSYNQILKLSDEMVKYIDEKAMKQTDGIEMKKIIDKIATAVIGACAFGLELDIITNDKSDLQKYVNLFLEPGKVAEFKYLLSMMFPKFMKILKLQIFSSEATNFFHSIFNDVFLYRTENNLFKKDLAQSLIEARKDFVLNRKLNDEDKFCEIDIVANAILLFVAGVDTISTTASYCFYELALNKNIQDRLRAEINSTKQKYNGQYTNDYLMDLHYADMVLNETHRKYSITHTLIRIATQNYTTPDKSLFIEKGQKIIIPMYSIHNDPKYYPNPDVFDPERFTIEQNTMRHNGLFFPFGNGPRQCIGKRLSELELKIILSKILSKYEVLPCEKTEIPLKIKNDIALRLPMNGIWLSFKPITDSF